MELSSKEIEYKGRVVFQKVNASSFKRLPKAHFENEACFVFIRHGSFYVRAQTERMLLNTDTALLAKCLNYYYESSNKKESDSVEVVGVLFYPELLRDLFDFDIRNSKHEVNYNLKQVEVNKLLEHYRESINILLDNPELADEQLIKSKLREFILLMTKTVNAPSELDFLASMFKPNFSKFEEVIQHNVYSNLSLDEFASLCHMSLSTFKRKFKELYNDSPAKYFSKKKMNKAAELLLNTDQRVSDIAYDLGYDSLSSFNRVFKEQMAKSPSEFRMS